MSRFRLIHRAIISHLLVAVPPAVLLGLMVVDLNQQTLRTDAQQLHLSVAGRLRDAIEAEVDLRFALLRHAERTLSIEGVPLQDKTQLLRALVASAEFEYVALYTADGQLDSVVRPAQSPRNPPKILPQSLRHLARSRERAVGRAEGDAGAAELVVPLKVNDELRGYVVAPLDLSKLSPRVEALQAGFLGPLGRLEVVDTDSRTLVASPPAPVGQILGAHTPFEGFKGSGAGMESVQAGVSTTFVDADGQPWLASLVSSSELGWVVASSRPAAVAFVSLSEVRSRTLLLALIAALLAGLVGLLFARATAKPVLALARSVRESARGGFATKVAESGTLELAALGQAFNESLGQLGRYRAELRHRSQLQVRLSRHLTPSALHELLSQGVQRTEDARDEWVSVIYVDLARGSQLQAGPQDHMIVDVLQDLYAEACAAIEQQGGRVDRYSGDAVIGLFPESLVSTPVRAAHTAAEDVLRRVAILDQRWTGVDLAVGIGMVSQTGQVVSTPEGGEFTVSGALVEQAATLQQGAARQCIAMDETSRSALSAWIEAAQGPRAC